MGRRRTAMTAEKVVIVNRSRIGKRVKLVHPPATDVAALSLVTTADTWPPVTQALLAVLTQKVKVRAASAVHVFINPQLSRHSVPNGHLTTFPLQQMITTSHLQ